MLEAMAQTVAIKGYAGATVADVVKRAGVSRKTFYEQFADKEDCFLAACDYAGTTLHDAIARAIADTEPPAERLELLVRSYLRALNASPRGAIAFIIEARAATPAIRAHHRRILERFADLAAADPADAGQRLLSLAGVIAIEDIAANEIAEGRADQLAELEDTLVDLALRVVGPGPVSPAARRA
jgi:AcrR family transcriptional regulator